MSQYRELYEKHKTLSDAYEEQSKSFSKHFLFDTLVGASFLGMSLIISHYAPDPQFALTGMTITYFFLIAVDFKPLTNLFPNTRRILDHIKLSNLHWQIAKRYKRLAQLDVIHLPNEATA